MKKRKSKKKNKVRTIVLKSLIILILLFATLIQVFKRPSTNKITSLESSKPLDISYINSSLPQNLGFENVIEDVLKDEPGIYGIYIKNLKTGEEYLLNENTEFVSASLYKLWVMATVYQQINVGLYTEDIVLSENTATLNSFFVISPAYQEQKWGTITLTVKDALEQMIAYSDNYAALLLAKKVGFSEVSVFLANYGFLHSSIDQGEEDPFTTAEDIGIFFIKAYDKQLVSDEYSNKMLELLKLQTLNDKIPRNLPKDVTIAHKTGELYDYSHDAGIVYTENGDYIFVVLTKTDNTVEANETIAKLSEGVYAYFSD